MESGPQPSEQTAARLREFAKQGEIYLTDEQIGALASYLALLKKWNATHNLTAVDDFQRAWEVHILDSLSLLPLLRGAKTMIDVGSGAGLPGIPIAVAMPDLKVTLLDSNGKKSAFQRAVVGELNLGNVSVVNGRAEAFASGEFDVVASRALAELADFVRLTKHMLRRGGKWLAMKGVYPCEELPEVASEGATVVEVVKTQVPGLGQERHVVVMGLP